MFFQFKYFSENEKVIGLSLARSVASETFRGGGARKEETTRDHVSFARSDRSPTRKVFTRQKEGSAPVPPSLRHCLINSDAMHSFILGATISILLAYLAASIFRTYRYWPASLKDTLLITAVFPESAKRVPSPESGFHERDGVGLPKTMGKHTSSICQTLTANLLPG